MNEREQDIETITTRILEGASGVKPPSERWRDEPYTLDAVVQEMGVILSDAERYLGDDPEDASGVVRRAQREANLRDRDRMVHRRFLGLGEFASRFVSWLVARAARDSIGEQLAAARHAVDGESQEQQLGDDLRRFIAERLEGTISETEVTRRQKQPTAPLDKPKRRVRAPRRQEPRASLTPQQAEARLRQMVPGPHDPAGVWEAFKHVAALRVAPEPPERLDDVDGDMLLFECGLFDESTFSVDLVRQFAILDQDGQTDRLEQLHCTLSFDPLDELIALCDGPIWSDTDCDAWIAEVERSPGFGALRSRTPARWLEIRLGGAD